MARVRLTCSDGALRCALPERDWLPLTAALRHLDLPDVFVPPTDRVAAWCAAAGVTVGDAHILDDEDDLTRRALRLKAAAVVEVELSVSVCGEGAMVLAWTNGRAASSLTRQLHLPADEPPRLVDGVVLSAFPVERVAAEVLRHVPSGGATPEGVETAVVGPGAARDLVLALRSGDRRGTIAASHRAGFPEPPRVLRALATGLVGDATVVVRGLGGTAQLRIVLCEVGWVEIHATPDGRLRHTPYDETGLLALLRRELAAQLPEAA